MKREAAPRRTRIESKHSNAGSFTPRLCLPALESTWERQRNQSWFCFCCPSLLCFLKNTSSTMRTELRFSRRWLRDTRKTKTFSLGGQTEFKRIFSFWLSGGRSVYHDLGALWAVLDVFDSFHTSRFYVVWGYHANTLRDLWKRYHDSETRRNSVRKILEQMSKQYHQMTINETGDICALHVLWILFTSCDKYSLSFCKYAFVENGNIVLRFWEIWFAIFQICFTIANIVDVLITMVDFNSKV